LRPTSRSTPNWISPPAVSPRPSSKRRSLGSAAPIRGSAWPPSTPALALLDEPAAGQSYDEALRLAKRVAEVPEIFGSAVLLVDHDMDLVRAACAAVTVLDFGKVLASGPTAKVLELPSIKTAYLGIVEAEAA
jgi:ABC-type hemin transport system ATPase subunit